MRNIENEKNGEIDPYERVPHNNDELRKHIRKRYHFYKNLCKHPKELDVKFYRDRIRSVKNHLSGLVWGFSDGILTGYALGGKWGGNGGWIAGGITQLLGLFVSGFVTGIYGAFVGALTNRNEVGELLKDYRYSIGSTNSQSTVKNNTKIFPGYVPPMYMTAGDQKPNIIIEERQIPRGGREFMDNMN